MSDKEDNNKKENEEKPISTAKKVAMSKPKNVIQDTQAYGKTVSGRLKLKGVELKSK
jgi:hypothetical protein